MAPELTGDNPSYKFETDIYALGVTFWEIASQKFPWENLNEGQILRKILQDQREVIPQNCPQEYAQIIQKCWHTDPNQRMKLSEIREILLRLCSQNLNPTQEASNQNVALSQKQSIPQITSINQENITAINERFKLQFTQANTGQTQNQQILQQPKIFDYQPKNFSIISTVCFNSNKMKTYSLQGKNFQQEQIDNLESIQFYNTQVEQIQENILIISGGIRKDHNRFTIYEPNNIQDFDMLGKRYSHRTIFDRNENVYIISGSMFQNENYIDVSECEYFNLNSQQFKAIPSIGQSVEIFGCGFSEGKIHVFGGFNNYSSLYQNSIQVYDTEKNQWINSDKVMSQKSTTTAIWIPYYKYYLIYKNGDKFSTQIFDLQQVTVKGSQYTGTGPWNDYTQPIIVENKVYQFDHKSNLFAYDLTSETWQKIE